VQFTENTSLSKIEQAQSNHYKMEGKKRLGEANRRPIHLGEYSPPAPLSVLALFTPYPVVYWKWEPKNELEIENKKSRNFNVHMYFLTYLSSPYHQCLKSIVVVDGRSHFVDEQGSITLLRSPSFLGFCQKAFNGETS
jgi:hypothetical protein